MKLLFLGFLISLGFFSKNSFASFDHSHKSWDLVLKQYTLKKGHQVYFKYNELKKNEILLNSYLEQLEATSRGEFNTFTNDQKLAFWINSYNAYTVQIIILNYPIKSIKDIRSGIFSSGPWKKEFITLLGKKMSLDNIEHDTIRKDFNEPRIHFAVNCASIGCPSLLQEAFVAVKLEDQLERASQNFLQNKTKNFVKGNTLYISQLFKWYGKDFDKNYGGFREFIVKSLKLPEKKYDIEYNEYDWNLNEWDQKVK